MLETLMGVAAATRPVRTGPRDAALRRARVCYDHLAGTLGAALLMRVEELGRLERVPQSRALAVSAAGEAALRAWLA